MRYTGGASEWVHDEVDIPRSVCEKIRRLDVCTPLTLTVDHLVCLYLGGWSEEVRKLIYRPIVSLLGARVSSIGGEDVKYKFLAPAGRWR